jgi:hypothetical protein
MCAIEERNKVQNFQKREKKKEKKKTIIFNSLLFKTTVQPLSNGCDIGRFLQPILGVGTLLKTSTPP